MAAFCVLEKVHRFRHISLIANQILFHRRIASLSQISVARSLLCPKNPTNPHCLLTTANLSTSSQYYLTTKDTAATIDDFRAREEQRERDAEEEQEEPAAADSDAERIQQVRKDILNAALPFVSSYGWTRDTIAKGAESIGYPGVVHGMFPAGGFELIKHFYLMCNENLINELNRETAARKGTTENLDPIAFVTRAIKLRLQMIEPYLAHWPQALAIMSLPANVPTSLAQILTLVDDIGFCAGDRSVDFSWYTRRVGLATIYKMTELYMLQDSSMDHQETWKFLERRMQEAMLIQEVISSSDTTSKNMSKTLNSTFITARNILGLNFEQRGGG